MRGLAAIGAALSLAAPAVAAAQVPLPQPPVLPPGGGQPPPEQPPPAQPAPAQPAPPLGAPAPSNYSVARRIDAARTGHSADDAIAPPFRRLWRVGLQAETGSPLIAQGLVFVVSYPGENSERRPILWALDQRTGRARWRHRVAGGEIVYDAGRVMLQTERAVQAFAADSGEVVWTRKLRADPIDMVPPVAYRGTLYLGSPGLRALNVADGSERWVSQLGAVDYPATDGERVYAGDGCNTEADSAADGHQIWEHRGGCSTGGEWFAAVYAGRVYSGESGTPYPNVFDAASGSVIRTPAATRQSYAFADGKVVTVRTGDALVVRRLSDYRVAWRTPGRRDSQISGALERSPVVANATVFQVSGTRVYAHALDTGESLLVDQPAGDFVHGQYMDSDIGAGQGVVVVPAGSSLVAYASAVRPRPRGVAALAEPAVVRYRRRRFLDGRVGRALRASGPRKVRLSADGFPFRGFGAAGAATTRSDGSFTFTGRPAINTRLRVSVPGTEARSRVARVWVYPRLRFHARAVSRRAARVQLGLTGPPRVRLAGRRVHLYLLRGRRLTRLGAGRLGGAGRGGARAAFTARLPAHGKRSDRFAYCIRRMSRLGLGRPDALDRHCGAGHIRL